jgi:hypothetical protein
MQHRHYALLTRGDPAVRADDPEPALCDLLDDPMLTRLMRSDRVSRGDLLHVIETARAHFDALADRVGSMS